MKGIPFIMASHGMSPSAPSRAMAPLSTPTRRTAFWPSLLAVLLALVLAGCGASGSGPGAASHSPSTGQYLGSARFIVHWPSPVHSRVIPLGTGSLKIDIRDQKTGADVVAAAIINAPSSGPGATAQHEFDNLPLGPQGQTVTFNVIVTAYAQADGQGAVVAAGVSTLTVSISNTPANPAMTTVVLSGIINHLVVALAPTRPTPSTSLVQNQTEQALVTAVDALGNMVPIVTSKLTIVSSNPYVATVSPILDINGNPTGAVNITGGASTGQTQITATYTGPLPAPAPGNYNLSASLPITVFAQNGNTTARFLYVANSGANTVSVLTVNGATGALSVVGTPAAVGANPRGAVATGTYVYVANSGGNTISAFSADASTGALTTISGSPFTVGSNPVAVALDATHHFLYSVNAGSKTVSQFSIDTGTGLLFSAGPEVATGGGASAIGIDPGNRFAYVANTSDNTVSGFTINPTTGALQPIGGAVPLPSGDVNPSSLTLDSAGRYLYVANSGSNNISEYAVDPNGGQLTFLGDIAAGVSPTSIAASHNFIYVANRDSNTIGVFSVGTNGKLANVSTVSTGTGALAPVALVPDASGNYLYETNLASNSVSVYSVNVTTGALTPVGTTGVGSGPAGLAATLGATGSVTVTAQ